MHYLWEYKLVQPLWKTVWRFLKKLKIDLLYDPAIPFLGIYLKEIKSPSWRDICTPMFIAALFTITKTWKQPKCLSVNEWIKKMWYTTRINGILFNHEKEGKPAICIVDGTWGHYIKWNKSGRERVILYNIIYKRNLKEPNS